MSLDSFLYAVRKQESGGNYHAVNSSSGALGAYQVMPSNVPSWTKRALGHSISTSQFLASKSAQDAVARTVLGGYYSKYGPAGAAAMWYSGQPDPNKTYGSPPVYKYVKSVLAIMGTSAASNAGGLSTGAPPAQDVDAQQASDDHSDCLVGFNLPAVGYVCILTRGQGRAITGGLLLAAAAIVGGAGLIILAAYGLRRSGALDAAASAASVVPGAGGVAGKLAAGSERIKATPKPTPKPAPAKPAPAKKAAAPAKKTAAAPPAKKAAAPAKKTAAAPPAKKAAASSAAKKAAAKKAAKKLPAAQRAAVKRAAAKKTAKKAPAKKAAAPATEGSAG